MVATALFPLAACSSGDSNARSSNTTAASGSTTGSSGLVLVPGPGFVSTTEFDRSSTCDNPGDYSPALSFRGIPQGTAQLALTMVDVDIDKVHWIQLIPPTAAGISQHSLGAGATELGNDFGEATYDGPCPPKGSTHHYLLTLSALTSKYSAVSGVTPHVVLGGIARLSSTTTTLTVTYTRN